jgi:glycosyltransferase involved in cell wall biosynthesis
MRPIARPRVDVIVPCYNYGRYLRRCVESLLTQDYVDVRVLVIDDGSTDDSRDVAVQLARADSRIEFWRHDTNRGHIATYNEGLGWVSGDYVLLISADDGLTPGALDRAVAVFAAHPEVGLVCGPQRAFTDEWPEIAAPPTWTARVQQGGTFIDGACAVAHNPVATPTAIVRASVHTAVGGYNPALPHTADLELWLRIAARSSVAHVEAVQAVKRSHSRNMQYAYTSAAGVDIAERRAAFESFFHICPAAATAQRRSAMLAAAGRAAFWAAHHLFERGDTAACDRLLDLAVDCSSEITTTPEWGRMRWKRRLGPRVWTAAHAVVRRLHTPAAAAATSGSR